MTALRLEAPLAASGLLPLSKGESTVLRAVLANNDADCAPAPGNFSPPATSAHGWLAEQAIRGEFLQWLCLYVIANKKSARPRISIQHAHFVTHVDLSGLTVPVALAIHACRFEQWIDISESHFLTLELDRSWAPELNASEIALDKDLSLAGFQCEGRINLEAASIGGDIDCTGAILGKHTEPRYAPGFESRLEIFIAEDVNVTGSVFLGEGEDKTLGGFKAFGEVRFVGARIGGDLDCIGGFINGLGGPSILLEKCSIEGGLFISGGFESVGYLRVNNSEIKNGVTADGGLFKLPEKLNPTVGRFALWIENSSVRGPSSFGRGFQTQGASLRYSQFGEVSLVGASIAGTGLDLRDMSVQKFTDDKPHWPASGRLHINGFSYGRILDVQSRVHESPAVNQRVDWIALDPDPSPQPYRQLAQVLQNEGDNDGAKYVLEQMQRVLYRDAGKVGKAEATISSIIGYGYAPERAIWLLLGLTGVSWVVYRRSFLAGKVTPSEKEAYQGFKTEGQLPDYYPRFSAFIYALENTFPLVNLGQASKWQPDPSPSPVVAAPVKAISSADVTETDGSGRSTNPIFDLFVKLDRLAADNWLRAFLWLQILLGWFLATLFLAGVGGLIRK
jgi:hypothetical protein